MQDLENKKNVHFALVKRNKLTLFRVRRHLLHESNEVEQELRVVVGQFQIIAVLPDEQTWYLHSDTGGKNKHVYTSFTPGLPHLSFRKRNTTVEKHETVHT